MSGVQQPCDDEADEEEDAETLRDDGPKSCFQFELKFYCYKSQIRKD